MWYIQNNHTERENVMGTGYSGNSLSAFTKAECVTQIIIVLGICPKDICTSVYQDID